MDGLPQSFMIFREELRKERLEKETLKREYQACISDLNKEMALLKEKLTAQQEMVKLMTEYAQDIEKKLGQLDARVEKDAKRSYH